METAVHNPDDTRLSLATRLLRLIDFRFILGRYVLREHIGPFIFAFVIITFILIIDFVPQLVDMVVGKDLPLMVILKVFFFQIGWMIALSVPMAVLVATLMAFGRLTADWEITAMKGSGVSILRVIYPVVLAAALMALGLIYFNNAVLPDFNHRARVLMQDVRRLRPTLKIRSGAFITDIAGYIILIDSVDHTTSQITGIKILDLGRQRATPRTIVAQDGFLTFANDGRDLIFDLRDGEIHEFDEKRPDDYRRLAFQTQRIIVSEVAQSFEESGDSFRTDREKSAAQMREDIEKWEAGMKPYRDKIAGIVTQRVNRYFSKRPSSPIGDDVADTIALRDLAREEQANARIISREVSGIQTQQKLVDAYMVEVYKKYAIPVACVAFVLIGAPLGVMARRGGMGISIGMSLGLFVLYWAFLIGGEDLADRDIISPLVAMWSANVLVGVAGVYLIYIVATEKSLTSLFRLTRYRMGNRT